MSNALLQQAGAQPQKQPKYVPIHISNASAGLVTNRAALHDISIGIYSRFYGGQPDALLGGSNIEISPQQTWKHRPGVSSFATLPSKVLTVYPFFNPAGNITLYQDTASGIYQNGSFFASKATTLQTSFLQIGNTLYLADGVQNRKIINGKIYAWAINGPGSAPTVAVDSIGGGAAASFGWVASTVFSTMGLLKDTNGNVQQLIGVNADGSNSTSTVIGTSGVGEPNWSNTSAGTVTEVSGLEWECYGPVGSWVAGATYTNASAPGSSSAPAAIFDPTSGNIFVFITGGAGTGTAGSTPPNFKSVPLNGSVGDHGFKWFNIGPPKTWQPSTSYTQWGAPSSADPTAFVVEPTTPQAAGYGSGIQQTVFIQVVITPSGGTSDSSHTGPKWSTSLLNPVTRDGQLNYQFLGTATWASATTYTAWVQGASQFGVIYDGTNFQVCIASGLSGGSAPSWGTAYGVSTFDGSVTWACVGPSMAWAASTKWFLPPGGFSPPVAGVNPYGGASILDSNKNVESVTASGKSGVSAPSWATSVGATTADGAGNLTWTLTALASSFTGGTALVFTKGYGITYAWKSRTSTDFYVTHAPNGQSAPLGPPTGSGTGGITTAAPAFQMPTGSNAGAVLQYSGFWPPDTQYDTVCVFRSTDGSQGGPYLEVTEIACPTPVNGAYQGTWTFYDSVPDTELNELIEADTVGENSPPPAGLQHIALHMNRIWGNVGNIDYASSGPDIPVGNGNGYEGWAPANTYFVKSPVTAHVPTQSGLLAFTTSDVFIIAGGPAVSQFFPWNIAANVGLVSTNALCQVGGEIYMFSADKRLLSFQPGIGHAEVGFAIADQLAGLNPTQVYVTEHANGNDPSSIYVGDGVNGWFRLTPRSVPGFVSVSQPVWSPFATVVSGCTGVQSVSTAPGVRNLLIFQSSGTIGKRDVTVAQDFGSSFSCTYTIGSIVLAHPGQLAELGFVTFDFASQGSPTVSYLLNEIAATTSVPFKQFATSVPDPPLVYGTVSAPASYSPKRYYFQQTTTDGKVPPPLLVRHMQLQVNYPSENKFHELYSFTIDGALHAEL